VDGLGREVGGEGRTQSALRYAVAQLLGGQRREAAGLGEAEAQARFVVAEVRQQLRGARELRVGGVCNLCVLPLGGCADGPRGRYADRRRGAGRRERGGDFLRRAQRDVGDKHLGRPAAGGRVLVALRVDVALGFELLTGVAEGDAPLGHLLADGLDRLAGPGREAERPLEETYGQGVQAGVPDDVVRRLGEETGRGDNMLEHPGDPL
jgi:hypothetical protein